MPAPTANFLTAWRQAHRDGAVLVSLALTDSAGFGTATFYLSHAEVQTPAGAGIPSRLWEPAITDFSSIQRPGGFLSNDPAPATVSFTIGRRRLANQLDGDTLHDLLFGYRWDGSAVVTVYLWERSLTSFDDAAQVFKGRVQTTEVDATRVVVHCRQRTDLNLPISPRAVQRALYPRAPEDSVGLGIPICYGKLKAEPMREPFGAQYDVLQRVRELVAGGSRVAPAILVDTGRGGGGANPDAKVLVAGHALKQLGANSPNYGTAVWAVGPDGKLHSVDIGAGQTQLSGADGAGFTIPDASNLWRFPVVPNELEVVANFALDPKMALDPTTEYTYARLDYTNLARELRVRLTTLPAAGDMAQVYSYCVYRTGASVSGLTFEINNTALGIADLVTMPASTTPTYVVRNSGTWGSNALPNTPWQFADCVLRVYWGAAPAGTCDVFFIGLVVKYRPAQEWVESARVVSRTQRRGRYNVGMSKKLLTGFAASLVPETIPPVTELRGRFYAQFEAQQDDGSGTYTGAASAVIERPPDVAGHVLVNYGGQTLAQIERGTSTFGSFVDARALLKTWRASDMVHAFGIGEEVDVGTVIAWIAESSASWVFLDSFTDKWAWRPWRAAAVTDYTWKFGVSHILDARGPEVWMTPDTEVGMGVRINYGHDAFRQAYAHETAVGIGKSVAGHLYRNLRDETCRVNATCNKLDFNTAATNRTATVPTADYADPQAFARAAATAMHTTDAGRVFAGGWGGHVEVGFNETFQFNDGLSKIATIAAGVYTMEDLCAAVQAAMNASSSGWTVTYSRTTRCVTVDRASGTKTIKGATHVAGGGYGWPSLGIRFDSDVAAPQTGWPREEDRVWLAANATLSLLWRTGTNGGDGLKTSCAEVAGFDPYEDSTASGSPATQQWMGYAPKGALEESYDAARRRWNPKRQTNLESRVIYDTDTAREVRNRVAELTRKARVNVRFDTWAAPDIRRSHVFEFDATLDALMPFPDPDSDGSWVGKRFQVVEDEQLLIAPSLATRIVAVCLN